MIKDCNGMLFASDLDGTLVTADFKIPDINMKAIERFKNAGGKFIIATGRSIESGRAYVNNIQPNAPCVMLNGVVIYDFREDKIIWDTSLPPQAKSYLSSIKNKFPDLGMEVFAGRRLYLITPNEETANHVLNEALEYIPATLNDINGNWYKALFAGTKEEIDTIEKYAQQLDYKDVEFVRSSDIYFEMLPLGANKGEAVERLAKLMNLHSTFCMGDYDNDLEMISSATIGAAPCDAVQEAKDAAKMIFCRCEDGAVAEFIEYIMSEQEEF